MHGMISKKRALLQKAKFEFEDTLFYFSGLFPKFRSEFFGKTIFINEREINLCATTNDICDMYFIDDETLAFNDGLNQS